MNSHLLPRQLPRFTSAAALAILLLLPCPLLARGFADSDLIGVWSSSANLGVHTVVFARDHTYKSVFTGAIELTITGTWKLVGNEIVTVWTSNSLNPDDIGKVHQEKIVKLTHAALVTMSPGYQTTYDRQQ